MITNFSPIPIYQSRLVGETLEQSQQELLRVVSELDRNDLWQSMDSKFGHGFSPRTPTNDLLKDMGCAKMYEALGGEVGQYLKAMNPDMQGFNFRIEHSWLTNMPKGRGAVVHKHGSTDISGVYYVLADEDCGDFVFLHQQNALSTSQIFRSQTYDMRIPPKVGNLILFPSWVDHYVLPNQTDKPRVSLSFNISIPEYG